jgi:hypothetical protein
MRAQDPRLWKLRCRCALVIGLAFLASAAAGCGASQHPPLSPAPLRPDQRPTPIGRGPSFALPAVSAEVARRKPISGFACLEVHSAPFAVHVELFAQRLVVPIPAGIGIAPPQRRRGAYVLGGACSYAVRTLEPTGVVLVDRGYRPTLGDFFAIWGQPLARDRLAWFRGGVAAFVDGSRWPGLPDKIPLRRHAEIVLEVGGELAPHPAYRFPPGL